LYEETMTGTAVYIYGPTGRIAKRTTINQETNIFYYNTDHLGSIRLVTDSSKNIVSAITYHPFGGINIKEGSEDYLFTGKEKDSTGFYYYGARYYDSELGRFLTRDLSGGRIQTPKTLNRFTYCLNNPLKYIDPDGRECVKSYPTSLERRVLLSRFIPSVGYVTVKYNYGGGFAYILIMCVELSRAVAGMVPFGKENYDKFLEKVGYDYFYAQTIYGGYLEPSKALEEFLYFEGIEEVDIEELIRIKLSEDAFWVYIREGDNEYRLLIIKDENGVWNIFQGYEFKDPDKGSNNFTEEGNIACDPSRGIYPE
jgi:RHS repeat-associated protein